MQIDEQALIDGCLRNDRIAQRTLYQRFAGKMLVVCLRYVPNRDGAEDVLQDAFVKVFQHLHTFRYQCPLQMWIRKIVVNTSLNHLRAEKNWQLGEDIQPHHNYLPSSESSIDHLQWQDLMELIQRLPKGCRTIFNLYAIEGYQHDEIAEMLQISAGTSKSQFSRARQLLQEMLSKQSLSKSQPKADTMR
jgi:RNA polymerase sigma factor (sigma-70 family)